MLITKVSENHLSDGHFEIILENDMYKGFLIYFSNYKEDFENNNIDLDNLGIFIAPKKKCYPTIRCAYSKHHPPLDDIFVSMDTEITNETLAAFPTAESTLRAVKEAIIKYFPGDFHPAL